MITHSALDIIDERKLKPQPQTTGFDPYLGQLYMIDDYKVYGIQQFIHYPWLLLLTQINYSGSCSNTNTKIILICENNTNENIIKEFINQVNLLYVKLLKNPFYNIGEQINSKKMSLKINLLLNQYNPM